MRDINNKSGINNSMSHDMLYHLDIHDHLCMVCETQEEQFSAVSRFMKIGLRRREKCICIADENNIEVVIKEMQKIGIKTDYAIRAGALSIITRHDSYIKQGYFDPDWMVNFVTEAADDAKSAGFSALRVIGDMSWALGDYPGVERLIEYESKVDCLFPDNNILAICLYDRNRFSKELIDNVINIHPCCWI